MFSIAQLWRHSVTLFGDQPAFGTRDLLTVHDDKQPDGRIFEKWELGEYQWQSYKQAEEDVGQLASGLQQMLQQTEKAENKVSGCNVS